MRVGKFSSFTLALALLCIALFNAVDYFATETLVVHGGHLELNPLMRFLVGSPLFVAYKLLLIPSGLVFLWCKRRVVLEKMMTLVFFTCGIYGCLMLYIWLAFYF
mgnify:CR=1 FL=1